MVYLLVFYGHEWSINRKYWSTIHNNIIPSRTLFHWFFQHRQLQYLVTCLHRPTKIYSLWILFLYHFHSAELDIRKDGVILWQLTTPFSSIHNSLHECIRPYNLMLKTRRLNQLFTLLYIKEQHISQPRTCQII